MGSIENQRGQARDGLSRGVDVWLTSLDACTDKSLLMQYPLLLSEPERGRWRRFVFDRDRHTYLVSHALQRLILGHLAQVDPRDLDFGDGPNGKPFLRAHRASAYGPLEFNLSHTRGMAVLCTAIGGAVGVDIEYTGRPAPMEIAPHCFSGCELEELSQCVPDQRDERFWSLWTLKEAYLKATGRGLSEPLDGFSFALNTPQNLRFSTSRGGPQEASRWWFAQWWASPAHIAALCVERVWCQLPEIRLHDVVPLSTCTEQPIRLIRWGGCTP